MDDLERFAVRLIAEWHDDPRSGSCPAARWLDQFASSIPLREPDSCADGVSLLPCGGVPIRWYDDGEQIIGFWGGPTCYVISWRDIERFLSQFECCDDDELPPAHESLPLAG